MEGTRCVILGSLDILEAQILTTVDTVEENLLPRPYVAPQQAGETNRVKAKILPLNRAVLQDGWAGFGNPVSDIVDTIANGVRGVCKECESCVLQSSKAIRACGIFYRKTTTEAQHVALRVCEVVGQPPWRWYQSKCQGKTGEWQGPLPYMEPGEFRVQKPPVRQSKCSRRQKL